RSMTFSKSLISPSLGRLLQANPVPASVPVAGGGGTSRIAAPPRPRGLPSARGSRFDAPRGGRRRSGRDPRRGPGRRTGTSHAPPSHKTNRARVLLFSLNVVGAGKEGT